MMGCPNSLRGPLDPVSCTRCGAETPTDAELRPERVSSRRWCPQDPRATFSNNHPIEWAVDGDYSETPGRIAAMLCPRCLDALTDWIYLSVPSPRRS